MSDGEAEIAGLRTLVVEPQEPAELDVVVLHGYAMTPEDLAPFTRSIGVRARFYLPEGTEAASPSGKAWWALDLEARARAMALGPRDLHAERPPGAPAARARLVAFLAEIRRRSGGRPVALVGFSQGGMLAADTLLRERVPIAALALLSSSRITADEWAPLAHHARRLPVLVSHGREDADLSFAAGERLRDLFVDGGADVRWVPFEQGHQIPLVVWRKLRALLTALG
jgi:phospholipase/carboxylesterase